jgi:hypothetical protein
VPEITMSSEDLERIINVLLSIAPSAGILIVVAVCFRIMGETPGKLLTGLAAFIWGWRNKDGE